MTTSKSVDESDDHSAKRAVDMNTGQSSKSTDITSEESANTSAATVAMKSSTVNEAGANKNITADSKPKEHGGPKGLEPTRYGDWEKNGRCSDF